MQKTKVSILTASGVDSSHFVSDDGTRYVVVYSYDKVLREPSETMNGRRETETLAYKSDAAGRTIDRIPLKASKKLEDHHKFVEGL